MMSLVQPILVWSIILVLWVSQDATEGNNQDVCQKDKSIETLYVQTSSSQDEYLEMNDISETFTCLLYPTNLLNCSWSFLTLQKDAQLSVCISICDRSTTVDTVSYSTVEIVGSRSLILQQHKMLYVILQFNMSLPDSWKVYTYTYDMDMLEVLPPPSNVSATLNNGNLSVTWSPPRSRSQPLCFEYELDLGDQETPKLLSAQLSINLNADPSHTYRVRLRSKKMDTCHGSAQWSNWSPTVTVKSVDNLNALMIFLISLGILLPAVLLLLCNQRVYRLMFPQIPRPPPKYIYFLEKNNTFNFFPTGLLPKPEEEIVQVEDVEENIKKAF